MAVFDWLNKILLPPDATPIDFRVQLTAMAVGLSIATNVTMSFAYLPQLTRAFGAAEEDLGYYVGLISGSLFLGRTLSSFLWGWLSDIFGRRLILQVTTVLTIATTVLFGFSTSLLSAGLSRLCLGIVNGQIIILKAIIYDVSDDSNQNVMVTCLISVYTIGLTFGPTIGGLLSEPGKYYPGTFPKGSLFVKFPFLLPNIVVSVLIALGMIPIHLYLNIPSKKSLLLQPNSGQTAKDLSLQLSEKDSLIIKSSYSNTSEFVPDSGSSKKKRNTSKWWAMISQSTFFRLFRVRKVAWCSVLFSMTGFAGYGYEELIPLWLATPVDLGGKQFTSRQIGWMVSLVAFPFLLFPIIMGKVVSHFSIRKVTILALLLLGFLTPIIPCLSSIGNTAAFWVATFLTLLSAQICKQTNFVALNVFVNNATDDPSLAGSVNGFCNQFLGICRFVGPMTAGAIYAWSLRNVPVFADQKAIGFPFNQFFGFILLGLIFMLSGVVMHGQFDESILKKATNRP